jgi:hypothetical protein
VFKFIVRVPPFKVSFPHFNVKKAKAVPLHATEALGGEEAQLLIILD